MLVQLIRWRWKNQLTEYAHHPTFCPTERYSKSRDLMKDANQGDSAACEVAHVSRREPRDLAELPLRGVRVLEFGHTILGPCCGMVLADLGAEVLKVEPPGGDPTRRLKGFGAGYFAFFNRNKRSVVLNYKSSEGLSEALRLIAEADVLIENMGPGA